MFLIALLVGIGGAIGTLYRYWLTLHLPATIFSIPAPILCINILGCFFMGFLHLVLSTYTPSNQYLKPLLLTGFLGGFTTFSSFALEYGMLWTNQQYYLASVYTMLTVFVSLISFFIGAKIASLFS